MNMDILLSDEEFAALKNGNKLIFKRVFDQYYQLVKYVVCQCGIPREECNDIVQEIFLRFYQNTQKMNHQSSIKSWLVTSARNLAIDYYRKSRKTTSLENEDAIESEDNMVMNIRRELELSLIGDLIDRLAVETGDSTLVEFYRQGLSAREISEKNNEPISTVTNRLSRLRKKFSEHLKQHIEELRASIP